MIIASFDYYLIPLICASAGALLGKLATRRGLALAAIVGAIVLVFSGAVVELLWHESSRLRVFEEPRIIVAMALLLAIPPAASLVIQWIGLKENWKPILRFSALAVSVLPLLVFYWVNGLYILCYVGHDCI